MLPVFIKNLWNRLNKSLSSVAWIASFIWRDVRSGIFRWLALAVVLAVAALSAVSLFADRIERGLQRDAAQLLGADIVVVSDQPLPSTWLQKATDFGLQTSQTAVFQSMARSEDEQGAKTRLVAVKAVAGGYPLRGKPTLKGLAGPARESTGVLAAVTPAPQGGPAPSTVWVDEGVLLALNLRLGDQLLLGDASFQVAAIVVSEPDRGAGFTNFSPRVMMSWQDLAATGLIQPASRVTWRLLAADVGSQPPSPGLVGFSRWVQDKAQDMRGVRLDTLQEGRPEMRATIDRASTFLRLVAMLSVLMSAVVVAMAARDFALKRLDDVALLRVLGVSQKSMVFAYSFELLSVALLAGLFGLLLGGLFHQVFVWLLADLLQVQLPAPGWWPLISGILVAVLLTLGFGLPPLVQLSQVPALRVIRRELGKPNIFASLTWFMGLIAIVLVLIITLGQAKLAVITLGGLLITLLILVLFSSCLLFGLKRGLGWSGGQRLPLACRHAAQALVAKPAVTITQMCSLTLGLLSIYLLVLIRADLMSSWRDATPANAPDRFVINIQPDQAAAFKRTLQTSGIHQYDWYPMARGRLLAINGKVVDANQFKDDRAKRLVEREFNLSFAAKTPAHNTLVAGQYPATSRPSQEISIEQGIAESLGLRLGDMLSFDLAGQTMNWQVTSLRKVNWASLRVNFFAMVPAHDMQDWPITYISAFKQPPSETVAQLTLDQRLVRQFPNITVVDVAQSLKQVESVLSQVMAVVEFLFAFALVSGILILLAGFWSSREQRRQVFGVMRALGASREHLQRVQQTELIMLGALAGLLASLAAMAIAAVLASRVFEFAWQLQWWWPLAGMAFGSALVLLAGWWSLRQLLHSPVMMTLRAAQ